MCKMRTTKVYFVEPEEAISSRYSKETSAPNVFLCRGDVIDFHLCYTYVRSLADKINTEIKTAYVKHSGTIEEALKDNDPCEIYRVKFDGNDRFSDWYTDKAEADRIADKLHGTVSKGLLWDQKAKPIKFPIKAYLYRGEKGLFVKLNTCPGIFGKCSPGCYLFPDRSCENLQEGLCEITSVKMKGTAEKSYGFFQGHMVKYQMPSEEAIAEYLLSNNNVMRFWSVSRRKIYFVEDSIFGSFAYIFPNGDSGSEKTFLIADENGGCVESDYLLSMEDRYNSRVNQGYLHYTEKLHIPGTVKESVSLGDYLCQGYHGCSVDELLSKFHKYPCESKTHKDDSAAYIPEELFELAEHGVVEARCYQGVHYAALSEYAFKSALHKFIAMTASDMEEAIEQFNDINKAAEEKTRSLIKRGKLSLDIFRN